MFVQLAIHYPRPEYVDDVLAWRDENSNRLVGLAMWESEEAFRTSAERIFQIVADDPWDQWNERPIDVFHLTKP